MTGSTGAPAESGVIDFLLLPVGTSAAVALLAPVPEVGFVLQLVGAFGAVGGLVALRARRRWPGSDTSRIAPAWAALGLGVGLTALGIAALIGVLR